MRHSFCSIFLAAGLVFLLCSCLSENHIFQPDPEAVFIPESFEWEEVEPGISYAKFENPKIPLVYHIVQVDLSNPEFEIFEYYEPQKKYDKAVLISELNKKQETLVMVNTAPFQYSNKLALKFWWMPSTYKSLGIHISEGKIKSEPMARYCALAFFRDSDGTYTTRIFDSQTEPEVPQADFAFGGFFTILRDDEIREFPANNYDSRNGCGVSEDGKTLWFMVAEGERQKQSIGMTYPGCAEVFRTLGAATAMQFDGGGTSCLYLNGKNKLSYKPFRKSPAYFGIKRK